MVFPRSGNIRDFGMTWINETFYSSRALPSTDHFVIQSSSGDACMKE